MIKNLTNKLQKEKQHKRKYRRLQHTLLKGEKHKLLKTPGKIFRMLRYKGNVKYHHNEIDFRPNRMA